MKALAEYIFKNIVDNPDKVNITQSTTEDGGVLLTATVAEEDMGKVIGKSGKVINAIRQVLKIAAIRQNKRVNLTLAEPEGSTKNTEKPADKDASPSQEEDTPVSPEEPGAESPVPQAEPEK
ncbi:MAG: KH domain-containing protein [Candidatus Chisholmbacteria bacterium]|nr:KH domain-containing protein [Candidatus Chisholmbacteria bacterium]